VQLLLRYHNYSAEFKQKRINTVTYLLYTVLILFPIVLLTLLSYGVYEAHTDVNEQNILLLEKIIPLNSFMAIFETILVFIFVTTGIVLLLTLKKFSHSIYHNSVCKIIFTLVMWSMGMAL